jgi:ATP-binding cassette, subfamily F, member 3
MIQVINLSKAYGEQILFDEISFNLNSGERLGLVGRNGHGKSTLLNLLSGQEEPDAGKIAVPADYRVGYLTQHISFSEETVIKEICLNLPKKEDGWQDTYLAEAALLGLGFSQDNFSQSPDILSGGFQVRLHLAKLLISEPDLLLLDEPTNYLDIVSTRWLYNFLRGWKHELILVTHDQAFMDSVTTHTMAIHRTKVKKIAGSTFKLYSQIRQEEEVHEQTRLNQEKQRVKTEEFIRKFRANSKTASRVQSRIKALKKIEKFEELKEISTLQFRFSSTVFRGKYPLQIQDLSFGFESANPLLIENLSFSVNKKDRIAVIGKNGKGKTTLLNLLAGELTSPFGKIDYSPNTQIGYFGQMNIERLNPENTIEDEILNVQPDHNRSAARGICGLMMFSGSAALKKIKILSGGEKSRVLLGKILAAPANMLLLDEATNHLDMESTLAFMEAVAEFPGAVIMVTHSEMLLHQLATRLIVFDGQHAFLFEGTYQDFLDRIGWQDEKDLADSLRSAPSVESKKERRKRRAEIIAERSKLINPLKDRILEIETAIMELEEKVTEENRSLIELSKTGFGEDAAEISQALHTHKAEIENLFEKLEELVEEHDSYYAEFEKKLAKT